MNPLIEALRGLLLAIVLFVAICAFFGALAYCVVFLEAL